MDPDEIRRNFYSPANFRNSVANETVTVKSGSGILTRITVGVAGSASTVTVYDNTAASGTKIGVFSTSAAHRTIELDCAFTTGLTFVTAGTTPGDITLIYK